MHECYSTPYVTTQGDMWDMISLDFYDTPYFVSELISANPKYANVLVFEAGVKLHIPILPSTPPETLPPWKRGVTG